MKVVISQCKCCYENNQILTDYPMLQKYADKGYYVKYYDDYSDYDSSYWRENSIIVDLTNDEIFKLIQELTNHQELIIGYAGKYDYENYGIDFSIKIYDDYNE
jgi:alpha-glucosidase (family GH31 glycosyl hydrolase)